MTSEGGTPPISLASSTTASEMRTSSAFKTTVMAPFVQSNESIHWVSWSSANTFTAAPWMHGKDTLPSSSVNITRSPICTSALVKGSEPWSNTSMVNVEFCAFRNPGMSTAAVTKARATTLHWVVRLIGSSSIFQPGPFARSASASIQPRRLPCRLHAPCDPQCQHAPTPDIQDSISTR